MRSIRHLVQASRSGKGNDPSLLPPKPPEKLRLRPGWLHAGAIVFALALSVFAVPSLGGSKENDPLCVVLAVDTSGSMKKTDPRNLRRESSRLLVSLLGPEDKMGFVTFDTRASIRCPLESTSKHRSLLEGQIGQIRSDGTFTNLYDGLRVAHEALSPSGSRGRKAIVFLTDGKMDTGDPDEDLALTQALLTELVPGLSEENVAVYAIAFSPLADAALLDRIATATGGFFCKADSAEELHGVLLRIYRQLARPDALPAQGKTFLVDPSVREMTIVVTKAGPEDTVKLRTPSGRQLTKREVPLGARWFAAQTFEMITVETPQSGTWEIEYRQEAPREVFILTDLSLRCSFRENTVPLGSIRTVEICLEDRGETLPAGMLQTQGVFFLCELEPEGGNRVEVRLGDDGLGGDRKAGDGIYSGVVEPNGAGTYRLCVSALGKTFERRLVHEFRVIEPTLVPRQPRVDAAQAQRGPQKVLPEHRPDALDQEALDSEPPVSSRPVNWKLEIAQFFMVNAGLAAAAAAAYGIRRSRKKKNLPPGGNSP